MIDKTSEDPAPAMSKTKRKQLIWPEPLIIDPTAPHTHTIILLHGRGSNADRFGLELLEAKTPIFLGHGRNDEKVSVKLGEEARDALQALGSKVRWEDYDEGHWYKVPEEIDDIAEFLMNVMEIVNDTDGERCI